VESLLVRPPTNPSSQGASPKEQILEACRRDNVELFHEVVADLKDKSKEQIAEFFNNATDTMGNHLLHVCANYGACKPLFEPVQTLN
jgi:hypothetical protein